MGRTGDIFSLSCLLLLLLEAHGDVQVGTQLGEVVTRFFVSTQEKEFKSKVQESTGCLLKRKYTPKKDVWANLETESPNQGYLFLPQGGNW